MGSKFSEYTSILRPIILSFGVSIVALIFSLLTNKIVAFYSSLSGFALFAFIKSLHQILNSVNKLGRENIIINQSSKSKTDEEKTYVLIKTFSIFLVQSVFCFLIIIPIFLVFFDLIFNDFNIENKYLFLFLIVILSLFISLYEKVLAFLNGQLMLKAIFVVSSFSAIGVTVIAVLLRPSDSESIALIALLSGFLGLLPILYFLKKVIKSKNLLSRFKEIKILSLYKETSLSMMFQPLITALSYFVCQLAYLNYFGSHNLAIFSSSYILFIMMLSVVMSSARFYLQPTLAGSSNLDFKKNLLIKYIYIYLFGIFLLCISLIIYGSFLIEIVFAAEFIIAFEFFKVLILTMPISVINWILAIKIISEDHYSSFALIESAKDIVLTLIFLFLLFFYSDMYIPSYAFLLSAMMQGLLVIKKILSLDVGFYFGDILKSYGAALLTSILLFALS